MGREYDQHDPSAREVWADIDGAKVVIHGFGENLRKAKYRGRLLKATSILLGIALLIIAMAALAAGTKRAELSRLEALAASTQREAAEASGLRSRVASASETVHQAAELISAHPNPHIEIARLTALLGDSVHIMQFSMNGREIRLRGRAEDASSVMKLLTGEPGYAEVTAPQAIVKVANSNLEQFSLNLTLAGGADQ
jgi:hypothetical protein